MSCREEYAKLRSTVEALDAHICKFSDKKVKVSGQRARNSLLDVKKLCDSLRKIILDETKEIPVKKRPAKLKVEADDKVKKVIKKSQ